MSYILDALRRLEQDKEMAKKGVNPMEAILTPDVLFEKKTGGNRVWWFFLGMLLLITIIIATYGITKRIMFASHLNSKEDSVAVDMNKALDRSSPAAEKQEEIAVTVMDKISLTEDRRQISSSVDSPTPKEISSPLVNLEKGDTHTGNVKRQEPLLPVKREKPHFIEEVPEKTERVMENIETISPWRGEKIQISAIVWSQKGENRFAVVNLKTVREGDYVAGLELYEIFENGIILKDGGEKYKVLVGKH